MLVITRGYPIDGVTTDRSPEAQLVPRRGRDFAFLAFQGFGGRVVAVEGETQRNGDFIWVNYNDLTTTSLEIMVSKGNHPQMALIQISELS